MAFAFIQSRSEARTGLDPYTLAYTSSVTANSLLVAAIYWDGAPTITTFSDGVNGNWTSIGVKTAGADGLAAFNRQMFYFATAGAGATTITLDWSAAPTTTQGVAIHEYSVASRPPSLDGTAVYDNVINTTTATSSAITTTQSGDLLFGMDVFGGSYSVGTATFGGSAGADRESTNFGVNITADRVAGGAAGSPTFSATSATAGDDHMMGFVAFKEAASGAPVPPVDLNIIYLRSNR